MRNFFRTIFLGLFALLFISCGKEDTAKYYYVRYVATSIEPTDEYHSVRLVIPNETKLTRFFCKDTFDEEFGLYKSGTKIEFAVDEPKMDTYMVRLYVREKHEERYNLVREHFNNIDYVLP